MSEHTTLDPFSNRGWRLALAAVLVGLQLLGVAAQAQTVATETDYLGTTRRWLDQAVAEVQSAAATPLRMEVHVGTLDSRLRLAPCARVEPYLPPGTRLWGRSRLGLRCIDGASRWNVFLPITIKAVGQAWVLRRDVTPGTVLGPDDVMEAEVDWAEDPSPIMADAAQWVGQVAVRALGTGQALRQNMVRPAQVFQAGAQVRVVAQGTGFQISADGQAISPGIVGQLARVRMDNGRVMSGTVLDARTVKLEM
jgi:flagella basal body P-ring formation protein FlgA